MIHQAEQSKKQNTIMYKYPMCKQNQIKTKRKEIDILTLMPSLDMAHILPPSIAPPCVINTISFLPNPLSPYSR